MKKTFIIAEALLLGLWLAGCAFTDSGVRVNEERDALARLERKREDYESRYVIVMNSLERNVGDSRLESERDAIRKRILELNTRIQNQRGIYEQAAQDWEQKIAQDKLQKQINEKEIRNNAYKTEGE
jgi:hypothetical protein